MRTLRPLIILTTLALGMLLMQTATAQVCQGVLQQNLVSGGDFGSGAALAVPTDPGLSPSFQYNGSPPPSEGFYVIANSSNFGNPALCWTSTGDNSADPNGYMMLVNAGNTPGIFFQQTIDVCEGISYLFRADLLNLFRTDCIGSIPPSIDFLVNGQLVHSSGALPQDELWHTYGALVNIPNGASSATIALRTNAPGGIGNALAIDNIEFRHCAPELSLPAVTWACASGVLLSIDEALIPYPTPYYQWQRSFDGGTSWQDINGANQPEYFIANPMAGIQYRLLAANGAASINEAACRAVSTATAIQIQQPIVQYITPIICQGETLILGDQLLSQPGIYSITIPGSSGCDSLLEVTLFNHPSYNLFSFQGLCLGDEFLGQSYLADTTISFYYQTVQGCDSTITYEINVFNPQNLEINGNNLICAGTSTTWQAPPGYHSYQWSNGQSGAQIEVSEPGTYSLSVQNSQGCGVLLEQTLSVSDPIAELSTQDIACPGGFDGAIEVVFTDGGQEPYMYSIGNGFTETALFDGLIPGVYTLTVEDNLGCQYNQPVELIELPGFQVQLQGIPTEIVETGSSIPLIVSTTPDGDNYLFQWSGDGIADCNNCPATNWLVLGETVSLTVSTGGGCEQTLEARIDARNRYRVYWPNVFSPNNDGNNDAFAPGLGGNVAMVLQFHIFDRWGGSMHQVSNRSPGDPGLAWDGNWRGKPMNSGVYLYQAEIQFNDGRSHVFSGEVTLLR